MDGITVDRGLAGPGVSKVHGVNPVFLLEKIIRERIQDSLYWKKDCYQLNLLTLIDHIVLDVKIIANYYSLSRPSKFISLLLKLLQLQPPKDIIIFLLNQSEFKYLSALIALYIRITFDSVEIYQLLEPKLNDYRKLIIKENSSVEPKIIHMDEFIEMLLDSNKNKFLDLNLPRLTSRFVLEEQELLEIRESELQSEFEEFSDDDNDDNDNDDNDNNDE